MNKLKTLVMLVFLMPALAQAAFFIDEGVLEQRDALQAARQEQAKPKKTQPQEAKVAVKKDDKKEDKKMESSMPVAQQVWVARSGTTLRKTIEEWCRILDWTVIWEPSDLDYPNPATRTFEGAFEDAVKGLFKPYENAKRPLIVDGFRGNTVIVVSEKR